MTATSLTRRARFKRSNSVTAGVQADLELEGLAGLATVATEDKALQFGRSFQRHASEPQPGPRAPTYSVFRTVHTQGQWAYREGYPLPYEPPATDGSPGPAPAPTPGPGSGRRDSWMERGSRSLPDSGRTSPCARDGEWFIKMLRAEVEKLERWCLVSMATGSQQAARQLEGSRQAKQAGKEGLGSKRKTEVLGVVGVSQEAGGAPKPSSQPPFSSDHESEGSLGHMGFSCLLLEFPDRKLLFISPCHPHIS